MTVGHTIFFAHFRPNLSDLSGRRERQRAGGSWTHPRGIGHDAIMAAADDPSVGLSETDITHRWLSPVLLLLALLCFALPFATVSCDAPGGYGRVTQGGTTTYRGIDLATGARPQVTSGHLRPPSTRQPDRVATQPGLLAAAVLIGTLAVVGLSIGHTRRRQAVMAPGAALSIVTLVTGIVTAQRALVLRVKAELARAGPVHTKAPSSYVNVGSGFSLCLLLLLIVLAENAGPAVRRHRLRRTKPT